MREQAVSEFVVVESGISITITVTVGNEDGNHLNDRRRVEYHAQGIFDKMYLRIAKRFGVGRVKILKRHDRSDG